MIDTDLDKLFQKTIEDVNLMKGQPIYKVSTNTQLDLYSYFKQAMFGDCPPEPASTKSVSGSLWGMFNAVDEVRKMHKRKVWESRKGMSSDDAKKKYIYTAEMIKRSV